MQVRLFMAPLLTLFAVGFAASGRAADDAASKAGPEEAAIRKASASYLQARERGDAAAILAAWTTDGDYVDASGTVFKAAELIKKQFPAGSSAPKTETAPKTDANKPAAPASTIRIVSADVAIEDGVTRGADPAELPAARYTVIWKKLGGRWLIDSVREATLAPVAPAGEPDSADAKLSDLAWLVGDWTGSNGTTAYEMSANMLDDDRVLELKFSVVVDGRRVVAGSEYVTRDPETGEIKSSFIDSRGGHGQGYWSDDDGLWTVDKAGSLVDDTEFETTSTYRIHKDGSITWCSINPRLANQELPDVSVKFSRKASK